MLVIKWGLTHADSDNELLWRANPKHLELMRYRKRCFYTPSSFARTVKNTTGVKDIKPLRLTTYGIPVKTLYLTSDPDLLSNLPTLYYGNRLYQDVRKMIRIS